MALLFFVLSNGRPQFLPRGAGNAILAEMLTDLIGKSIVVSKVFEAAPEGVFGLVNMGGFTGDAVKLENDEAFPTTKALFVGDADIVASEIEAFVGEAGFIDSLGELGSEPVASVFEDGSEAVGAEFGEGDFFALGGDFVEARCELFEKVFGLRTGANVFEEKLLNGVLAITGEALGEFVCDGGDCSGGLFGEASPLDADFEPGDVFLHESLAFADSLKPLMGFFHECGRWRRRCRVRQRRV